ncbi:MULTISPECIES: flagellar hook-length control protein FliK [unclassified Ruegeria]|uniref:flagellar hook-length control protein FliK n=1 Tax=unclassified Ruegeria TaxID=2625375 RepID=UPI001AEB70BC|nr:MULTISPECIES: flagellar hook-length control protein FliK [unclassified Ruegeria]
MPNPLTLAAAAPTAIARPNSSAKEPGRAAGASSFEDILEQGNETSPATDSTLLDASIETTDETAEIEVEAVLPNTDEASVEAISPWAPELADNISPQAEMAGTYETPGADSVRPAPFFPAAADIPATGATEPEQTVASTGLPRQTDILPFVPRQPTEGQVHAASTQVVPAQKPTEALPVLGQPTRSKDQTAGLKAEPLVESTKVAPETAEVAATPNPTSPNRATPVAQLQLILNSIETEQVAPAQEVDAGPIALDEPVQQAPREVAQHTAMPSPSARAEIARAIAGQLAATIQAQPGTGIMEISLSPEELGRVSIVLNGRDDGLQMTIATERPDTMELMRRHLSVLTEEFQKLGYGNLNINLGTPSDSGARDQWADEFDAQAAPESEPVQNVHLAQAEPHPQTLAPVRGIDMRY